jgi:acyl-CoA reductase-like NAD-dependent aldehyde dehydrogenase
MSGRERGACLFKLADLIEENLARLALVEALDSGKPLAHTTAIHAPAPATMLRYYAGWADKITGLHIPMSSSHLNYTRHEPVGVCALVTPWNLPLIAVAAKVI